MILTVTPNPCIDKTIFVDHLETGAFMRSGRYTTIAGGKGTNVSRVVKALGGITRAMVVVGGHSGGHVVDLIENTDGVECIPVRVQSPTRTVTTVLERSTGRQTVFFEPGSKITPAEFGAIVSTFENAVAGAGIVTFGGTVSDRAVEALYEKLIPLAHAAGAKTILDSHGPEFVRGLAQRPYMVKPNLAEAGEASGHALDTEKARWHAVDWFHHRGIEIVVLSLGEEGAYVSRGDTRLHVRAPKIQEVNPVGSGDALCAAFAIGIHEGQSLEEMAIQGVAAGTANATTWDIGHFTTETLESLRQQVKVSPH